MTRGSQLIQKRKYKEGEGEGEGDDAAAAAIAAAAAAEAEAAKAAAEKDKPSDKEAELLKEVMKRKGNEQALKTELGTLKDQLKKFDGIDPEAVRSLLQEKTERERTELEKRGEFDRVKQQIVEQHQAELASVRQTLDGQLAEANAKLASASTLITELTIGRSFGDSAFVRDTLTLTPAKARIVYGSHFELQDGKVVAYDKPAGSASRTELVDGKGDPLPFDLAIEKIVKADPDYDQLIRSKVKVGAGSKSDPNAKATQPVASGRDRISAAISGGALPLHQ